MFVFLIFFSIKWGLLFFRLFFIIGPLCRFVASKGSFKTRVTTRYLAKCQIVRAVHPVGSSHPNSGWIRVGTLNRFSLEFFFCLNVYTSFSPKCVCVLYDILQPLIWVIPPDFILCSECSGSRVWKQFKQAKCES